MISDKKCNKNFVFGSSKKEINTMLKTKRIGLWFTSFALLLTSVFVPSVSLQAASCDRTAADAATLASEFAAATAGQTICLATADYGTWTGGNKVVTVKAAPSAMPVMNINFNNGDSGFTLDGISFGSGLVYNNANNITIKNSSFTGILMFDNVFNSNIVLDNNRHIDVEYDEQAPAGRISFPYSGMTHSGVTIQNSLFRGGSADGVQTGVGVDILNNEFDSIEENGHPTAHTDSIQLNTAYGSLVRGNYVHDGSTGIVGYDGVSNVRIEYNVVGTSIRSEGIELYSDDSSVVDHNTVLGSIYLDHKPGDPAGTGTVITNNITTTISKVNGSTTASQTHNLVQTNPEAGDIVGLPTYVGGGSPTNYSGFRLAAQSTGVNAGNDGRDVGIAIDEASPTVAITSPANNGVISGTTAVSANASDDIGVVGVTFTYGNNTIGLEDKTAPYLVNWDTTTASNGLYNLVATARDAKGNVTKSEKIRVNVTNPAGPSVAASLWDSSATPAVVSTNDNGSIEVGMKFRSELDGVVRGVRFYKASDNTGTHVGSLWTLDGTRLANVTFTNETASGWQEALFSSPVEIDANVTYMVSYFAPNGHYSSDGGYFSSTGLSTYPLYALQDGENGQNGMYSYGAGGAIPASDFGATNYWVDVVYEAKDVLPPALVIDAPAQGATMSGTVQLSATASDNVGVAGVQFKRGCPSSCVNIGPEITTGPYTYNLDTTGLTNGTYSITATARDAEGNTITDIPIDVTINNVAPQPGVLAPVADPSAPAPTVNVVRSAASKSKVVVGAVAAAAEPVETSAAPDENESEAPKTYNTPTEKRNTTTLDNDDSEFDVDTSRSFSLVLPIAAVLSLLGIGVVTLFLIRRFSRM